MSSYSQLIIDVVHLLDQFDPQNQSTDHFVSEAAKNYQAQGEAERTFIVEVLSGCLQYKPLLNVVVSEFYMLDGRNFLRSECNLYVVICYLAIFRLEELGLRHFTKIVNSQPANKMHQFLRFFFDSLNLTTWIKDEWCQIYDVAYVNQMLIDPLLRWQPDINNLIDHLANKMANRISKKLESQPVTVPREFNITKPKPQSIPMPEEIQLLQTRRKIPRSTYEPPKEQQLLETLKRKNRHRAEEHLMESNIDAFRCAMIHETEHKRRVLSEIKKEEEAKMKYTIPKPRPIPAQMMENLPIKLNTAAILRENVLYERRVKKELERIDNLIEGGYDPSKFEEMLRKKDTELMEQQLTDAQRHCLEGKILLEDAILAREARIEENKRNAALQKEEVAKMMQKHAEKRLQEEKEARELVERVTKGRHNTKQQKLKMQEDKQKMAKELNKETEELLQQALEKTNEEIRKKSELIREIRAMQMVPTFKHKLIDLAKPAGHNLLIEMSIVELRERLGLLKEAQIKAEEDKRDRILNEKQAKEQLLLDKLRQISLHREALSKKAVIRNREEELRKLKASKQVANNQQLAELQKKLEEKRREHHKLNKIQKINTQKNLERSMRSSFADRKSKEVRWWKNMEDSRENKVRLLKLQKAS
ncbi:cilia- and flagella-associated protein 99 isoform X1 [Chiloscyllium plagiosum]|uniref:cilia- and flagella-associated protein 99 isoform X1 n=1 Tax=Chiloscyllium plagiosum TaxID=36176 RepID=UPI001CB81D2C|nr:cilia- and flagella-associated protein 99 isoform X1 [Chiloscyllium plagiosum]XP_043560059.1 cilia- and flagella-associated protein 99 isoform X1 [Chiloscyllium plagiosum]